MGTVLVAAHTEVICPAQHALTVHHLILQGAMLQIVLVPRPSDPAHVFSPGTGRCSAVRRATGTRRTLRADGMDAFFLAVCT